MEVGDKAFFTVIWARMHKFVDSPPGLCTNIICAIDSRGLYVLDECGSGMLHFVGYLRCW